MAAASGIDEATQKEILDGLKDVGNLFQKPLPSSIDELFILLDKTENVLCRIWQGAPFSDLRPLQPIMKTMIADELLHHPEVKIQVVVAGCLSEITRIAAPDPPYEEPTMKEIFRLFMVVLPHLSGIPAYNYVMAFGILENLTKVQTCLLMMDVLPNEEIVKLFELFLNTISPDHHETVSTYMEMIMTTVIDEIDITEMISVELMRPLLASVRMDNKDVSPASWNLGKTVIEKCANMLRDPVKEAVKAMNLDVGEYAEIVGSLCQDTSNEDMSRKRLPKSKRRSKTKQEVRSRNQKDGNGNLSDDENPLETSNSSEQNPELVSNSSEIVHSETDAVDVQRKRGRRPKLMRPEEGYELPFVSDPLGIDLNSAKESLGKSGRLKKKERAENQQNEEEWSSKVRRKILQAKVKESGSSATKKAGKRPIVGLSFSDQETEETILDNNVTGEADLSHVGLIGKKEKRVEIILRKREPNKMVGSASASNTSKTKSWKKLSQEKKSRGSDVEYGDALVDFRIKVWWPIDKTFYSGTVTDYDPATKKHMVRYDDDEVEILNLKTQRWEILYDEKPEESSGQGAVPPSPPKDKVQEKKVKKKKFPSKFPQEASSSKRPKNENGDVMKSGDNSSHEAIRVVNDLDYEEYKADVPQQDVGVNPGEDEES